MSEEYHVAAYEQAEENLFCILRYFELTLGGYIGALFNTYKLKYFLRISTQWRKTLHRRFDKSILDTEPHICEFDSHFFRLRIFITIN